MSKQNLYPEGQDLKTQVAKRNRNASIWQSIFLVSAVVGIVALTALLYNIINGSFGLVAIENEVEPETLSVTGQRAALLGAPNSTASEDDFVLGEGIVANPYAIGFFGHAYFTNNQDQLKTIAIDGVQPTVDSVRSSEYPLTRPLYIYSSMRLMERKERVAGFINYYLSQGPNELDRVGYFPVDAESQNVAETNWLTANGLTAADALPEVDPTSLRSKISIVGSSTVFPLTSHMATRFEEDGFRGSFEIDSIGTSAGFELFCVERKADMVNASRPINAAELAACQEREREPVEFQVGVDALVIAVSQENTFLETVSKTELAQIFTGAEKWSDVNPDWPNEPIERFTPTESSGTLDIFAERILTQPLETVSKPGLIAILQQNLSAGLVRRLDSEELLVDRSQEELLALVNVRIVNPTVSQSWPFYDSIFNRDEIEATIAEKYPTAVVEFRSWLTPEFISNPQSSQPEWAGVRTAIFGSLWVVGITVLFSFPLGVGAAIYLEEYAAAVKHPVLRRVNEVIQTNINNLAGVPSIIYGILGLAIFVRVMEPITSGVLFGAVEDPTTANGRTIISAGLTLALLILPIIIISSQEAIRAVPNSLRQASYGLGATHWQTIWHHVMPVSLPGILTGTILAISRAVGETAPLVVIGASTFITVDPSGPFSKFTVLPIQIYQWTSRPQAEFKNIAAAAIIVLLVLLLSLNASAVLLRNRYSRSL
ncbi:MAG: phosphate ABC transporter permease PstA [Chloroflexota bacterium]